jgi:hypothetical protein
MTERKRSKIPKFKSREEEAAFWDSHDLSDFETDLREVRISVRQPLEHHLSVRLDATVLTELAKIARETGIGPSTLARIWLMERLTHEREKREVYRQQVSNKSP